MTPVIDITDRYNQDRYMRGGTGAWWLSRGQRPVTATIIHHSAGFYGRFTGTWASRTEEETQLDAMAADHRARFGIGPGYHYAAFPSGRLYAIGKYGTHRAHTKGREPGELQRWNTQAIGVVAMGDYDLRPPTDALVAALLVATLEVTQLSRNSGQPTPTVYFHGHVPTTDARGAAFDQATACPGKWLRDAYNLAGPPPLDPPSPVGITATLEDERVAGFKEGREEGWLVGFEAGYRTATEDGMDDATERRNVAAGRGGVFLPPYPGVSR